MPGSVHVPYVTGGILAKMRLPGFKKKNTDFVSQVEEAIPDKNTKIILACIWGGSLGEERSGASHACHVVKGLLSFACICFHLLYALHRCSISREKESTMRLSGVWNPS